MMRRSFYECSVCRAESLDPDETPRHKVTPFVQAGQVQLRADVVCQECVELCPFCGEYVTDEFARLGVGVRFRDWTDEGRLTPIYHAFCAGEAFLAWFANDARFDSDYATRDEIAGIVAAEMRRVA